MPHPSPPLPPEPEQEANQQESMPMYERTMAELQKAAGADYTLAGVNAAVEHHQSVTEQLLYKKAYLEAQLEKVNKALEQAKLNQPTMHLLDAIAKVGLGR